MSTPQESTKPEAAPLTTGKQFDQEKLISTIKTPEFIWFVGHVTTLVSVFFFALTYIGIFSSTYTFWYLLALVGTIGSFGYLVYKLVSKRSGESIFQDDNVHYFILSIILILIRPYFILTLLPFAIFSTFHVLAYVKAYILPVIGDKEEAISKRITDFITSNSGRSLYLASVIEDFTLIYFLLRLVTFRSNSLFPFLAYLLFIKVRHEKSTFTKNHIKSLEVSIDKQVGSLNQPALKEGWATVKDVIRKIGGISLLGTVAPEKKQQ